MINSNSIRNREILPDIGQSPVATDKTKTTTFNGRVVSTHVQSPTISMIKSLWFTTLSLLTQPFSSKISNHFAVASAHEDSKFASVRTKGLLKDHSIGEARNLATNEVVRNNKDFEAGKSLLQECKTKAPGVQWYVNANATPKSASIDGICSGIRIDIARDYLVHGKSVADIVAKNSKGGSAEAAANQAVYALIKQSRSGSQVILEDLLNPLQQLRNNQGDNSIFRADFRGIGQALSLLDPEIGKVISQSNAMRDFNVQSGQVAASPYTIRLLQLIKNKEIPLPGNDLKAFAEKGIGALEKQGSTNEEIESFKWLVAFLECKQAVLNPNLEVPKESKTETSNPFESLKRFAQDLFGLSKPESSPTAYDIISDPARKLVLSRTNKDKDNIEAQNIVAGLRGLSTRSVNTISPSYGFANEADYLEQYRDLPAGVYGISLSTGTGHHAITYIKNADGSGYILDPNRHQLAAKNMDETLLLLSELLATYPGPIGEHPLAIGTSHNLSLMAFEKTPYS